MRGIARGVTCSLLFFALSGASLPRVRSAGAARAASPGPALVTGQGFGSVLACAACVVGGVILASSGPGAILVAANTPGSAIVVAGCIASCAEAFS